MSTSTTTTTNTESSNLLGKILVPVHDAIKYHGNSNVKFVDGSWFLQGRNGRDEYEVGPRIAGAVYFDIDNIASGGGTDLNPRSVNHMMPSSQLFATAMDAMDITNTDHLIVYGTAGCMCTQARTWYQLRAMGHDKDKVHLMQGSLDDWIALGGPIDDRPIKAITVDDDDYDDLDVTKPTTSYVPATHAQNVVTLEEMKEIVGSNSNGNGDDDDAIIVDVRSNDRFLGKVEEPRPGLRLGHMPGAINLPFTDMLRSDMTYKSETELRDIVKAAGIDIHTDKRIIVSCGSGVTACVVACALVAAGRDATNTFVYDGSWMEWGGEQDTPIVTED